MDPVKEKIVDFLMAVIIIGVIAAIAWGRTADAGEVYMQLFKHKEATAPVRSLSTDPRSRMSMDDCLEQKAKVEAPLGATDGYSVPSGWVVDCIPVEYLDD